MLFQTSIKSFVFLAFLMLSVTAKAQETDFISFFKVTENKGKVLLSWQVTAGNTCNGIQIFRGTDSTQLIQIGEITGVCGSVDQPVDYTFVDETPIKNIPTYYRLQFGFQGYSPIVVILVNATGDGGTQVRPHPINTQGKILFDRTTTDSYILELYNLHGQKVLELTTTESFFDIYADGFPNGVYTFTISAENSSPLRGKLIINN